MLSADSLFVLCSEQVSEKKLDCQYSIAGDQQSAIVASYIISTPVISILSGSAMDRVISILSGSAMDRVISILSGSAMDGVISILSGSAMDRVVAAAADGY
jgi:hypothetical protein